MISRKTLRQTGIFLILAIIFLTIPPQGFSETLPVIPAGDPIVRDLTINPGNTAQPTLADGNYNIPAGSLDPPPSFIPPSPVLSGCW